MAEVRPLKALHYELSAISSLADVTAPPYDVIDAEQRAELLARSPFNVVEIDLPQAPAGRDPYEHAAETLEAWTMQGVLAGRPGARDLGADTGLRGPRRQPSHAPRVPRPGAGDRVRRRPGPPS